MPTPRNRLSLDTPSRNTRATSIASSSSRTPTHHRSTDEIALEEAQKYLRSPNTPTTRSKSLASVSREERHRHLDEARAKAEREAAVLLQGDDEDGDEDEEEEGEEEEEKEEVEWKEGDVEQPHDLGEIAGSAEGSVGASRHIEENDEVKSAQEDEVQAADSIGSDPETEESPNQTIGESSKTQISSVVGASSSISRTEWHEEQRISGQVKEISEDHGIDFSAPVQGIATSAASSNSSSSSSDSESDSDSDSDSDSGSDNTSSSGTQDSEEDEAEAELEKLLKAAALKAAQASTAHARDVNPEDAGDVLGFTDDVEKDDLPIPDISVPNLPRAHMTWAEDGSATAIPAAPEAGPSRLHKARKNLTVERGDHGLELDDRPYERLLTKKEKAAQPKKATTSELWASIPIAKSDLLPQMKRDYQALSLANSLDPKRFMKGGNRMSKVPDNFAIGTIIDQPRQLQRTTLGQEFRYRPGEIVKDLVKDQEAEGYAKRKYEELQWSKMDSGRKKGFRKRGKW